MAASPEAVYMWLKQSAETKWAEWGFNRYADTHFTALLEGLITRDQPLITLGIAQYGYDLTIAKKLWLSGDRAVRHAIAANELINVTSVFVKGDGLVALLNGDDTELQRVYIQNPSLDSELLASIIDRPGLTEYEGRWVRFVAYALKRADIRKGPPSGVFEEDGYGEHKANLPFISIYRLLINIPASVEVAELLCNEISSLGRWVIPPEEFQDYLDPEPDDKRIWMAWYEERELLALRKMLEKWIFKRADSDEKNDGNADWKNATYYTLRSAIASLVPLSKLKLRNYIRKHSDEAIRSGYYKTQNYNSTEEIRADFDKDGSDFLFSAVQNKCLYLRSKLVIGEYFDRLIDAASIERRKTLRRWRHDLGLTYYRRNPEIYLPRANDAEGFKT